MPATSKYPISVTTTISVADDAKLTRRAALQGISRAEVLRQLISALPEPMSARTGDTEE